MGKAEIPLTNIPLTIRFLQTSAVVMQKTFNAKTERNAEWCQGNDWQRNGHLA